MPEMDRVSWVIAVISAVDCWVSAATARRLAPTILLSRKKNGAVPTATIVSSQDSTSIAIRVLIRMTQLESTSETVLVTTRWTPPTSLVTRDWISPVRVPVKKPRDRLCRCRYSVSRRSRITRWPTMLVK